MWVYDRLAKKLKRNVAPPYAVIYSGCYCGHGTGLNNPEMERVSCVGPLPAGLYNMLSIVDSPHTGKATIILEQSSGLSYGRSGFRIHGDNGKGDFSASEGCIIKPGEAERRLIWASGDHVLQVI